MTLSSLRRVPQIHPVTGVSQDYWNEWVGVQLLARDGRFHDNRVLDHLQRFPVPPYTAVYESHRFADVVTPHNEPRVRGLERLAAEINALASPSALCRRTIGELTEAAHLLIYGHAPGVRY